MSRHLRCACAPTISYYRPAKFSKLYEALFNVVLRGTLYGLTYGGALILQRNHHCCSASDLPSLFWLFECMAQALMVPPDVAKLPVPPAEPVLGEVLAGEAIPPAVVLEAHWRWAQEAIPQAGLHPRPTGCRKSVLAIVEVTAYGDQDRGYLRGSVLVILEVAAYADQDRSYLRGLPGPAEAPECL